MAMDWFAHTADTQPVLTTGKNAASNRYCDMRAPNRFVSYTKNAGRQTGRGALDLLIELFEILE